MSYIECDFYREEIEDFEGCPGLDFYGDGSDDECQGCRYNLENFKILLNYQKDMKNKREAKKKS